MIEDAFALHIALNSTAEARFNTIVLAGTHLDLPFEADLDGDPLHDDQVRLEGTDGSLRVLTSSDPEVRLDPEKRLCVYQFRDVPPGAYAVSVKLCDGTWAPVLSGILITKEGASLNGTVLDGSEPEAIVVEDSDDAVEVDDAEVEVALAGDPGVIDVTLGELERM